MIIINYGGITDDDVMNYIEVATDEDIHNLFAEDLANQNKGN